MFKVISLVLAWIEFVNKIRENVTAEENHIGQSLNVSFWFEILQLLLELQLQWLDLFQFQFENFLLQLADCLVLFFQLSILCLQLPTQLPKITSELWDEYFTWAALLTRPSDEFLPVSVSVPSEDASAPLASSRFPVIASSCCLLHCLCLETRWGCHHREASVSTHKLRTRYCWNLFYIAKFLQSISQQLTNMNSCSASSHVRKELERRSRSLWLRSCRKRSRHLVRLDRTFPREYFGFLCCWNFVLFTMGSSTNDVNNLQGELGWEEMRFLMTLGATKGVKQEGRGMVWKWSVFIVNDVTDVGPSIAPCAGKKESRRSCTQIISLCPLNSHQPVHTQILLRIFFISISSSFRIGFHFFRACLIVIIISIPSNLLSCHEIFSQGAPIRFALCRLIFWWRLCLLLLLDSLVNQLRSGATAWHERIQEVFLVVFASDDLVSFAFQLGAVKLSCDFGLLVFHRIE